jgi:hypothetical protein
MNYFSKIKKDKYKMKSFISNSGNNEKYLQENITLKCDILIYKDDTNKLIEMNNKFD